MVRSRIKKRAKRAVAVAFVLFCATLIFASGCFAEKNVERF